MEELILEGSPTICEIFAVNGIEFVTDRHDFVPEPNNKYIILFPDERTDYWEGHKAGFYTYEKDCERLITHPKILLGFLEHLKEFVHKHLFEFSDSNKIKIDVPFVELTNFITPSNRFGTFGPSVSKKLANAFAFYKQDFLFYLENTSINSMQQKLTSIYCHLLEIFQHGSNNGFVIFT